MNAFHVKIHILFVLARCCVTIIVMPHYYTQYEHCVVLCGDYGGFRHTLLPQGSGIHVTCAHPHYGSTWSLAIAHVQYHPTPHGVRGRPCAEKMASIGAVIYYITGRK